MSLFLVKIMLKYETLCLYFMSKGIVYYQVKGVLTMSEQLDNFKKDAEKAKDQVLEKDFAKEDKEENKENKNHSIKEDIQKTFE